MAFPYPKFRPSQTMESTMTVKEAAAKWGISERRVRYLCQHFKVYKARRLKNGEWSIPGRVEKPRDGRAYRYWEIPGHMKDWVKRADEVLAKAKAQGLKWEAEDRWQYFLKGSTYHLHTPKKSRLTRAEVFAVVDGAEIKANGRKLEHVKAAKSHLLALELVREAAKKRQLPSAKLMKRLWTTLKFGDTKAHRVRYLNAQGEERLKAIVKMARNKKAHPLVRAGDVLNEMFLNAPFDDHNIRTGYLAANLILMNGGYPPVIINKIIFKKVVKYCKIAEEIRLTRLAHKEPPQTFWAPEIRHAFVNRALINAIHFSAREGLYAVLPGF